MDHIYIPNFAEPIKLALQYRTEVSEAFWGKEMRASFYERPVIFYSYTLTTVGKDECLARRFVAEKELYNECRVPLLAYPVTVEIEDNLTLRVPSGLVELFNGYIYYNGTFFAIATAYTQNTEGVYRIGLSEPLDLSTGTVTIYPVIIGTRVDDQFTVEDYARWTRTERIEWRSK